MNNEQAKAEYIRIIRTARQRMDEIEAAAKKDGTWKRGLDSNRELFASIEDDAKKQIAALRKNAAQLTQ